MRFWQCVILLSILPSTALALDSLRLDPIEGGDCGLFVEDADAHTPGTEFHPLLAHDAMDGNKIRMSLDGQATVLPLIQSTPPAQKFGDRLARRYANDKGAQLMLELTRHGYCGDETESNKSESCESVRYTGTMMVSAPGKMKRYNVIVNDGC